jgi:hypothetical protein
MLSSELRVNQRTARSPLFGLKSIFLKNGRFFGEKMTKKFFSSKSRPGQKISISPKVFRKRC